MQTKRSILFTFLLIILIIPNFGTITPGETLVQTTPKAAATVNPQYLSLGDATYGASTLRLSNTKGSNQILWEINPKAVCNWISDVLTPGTCTLSVPYINDLEDAYDSNTGKSSSGNITFVNKISDSIAIGSAYKVSFNTGGYSTQYILNDSTGSSYTDTSVVSKMEWSYYNSGGSSTTVISNTMLTTIYYDFTLSLILNSTYYNFGNTRPYLFDKIEGAWVEQDINNIKLQHPEYKLKLLDKNTNEIIYEDADFEMFTTYRTITIDSVQVQNNAAEPIVVSIADPSDLTAAAYTGHVAEYDTVLNLTGADEIDFSELLTGFEIYDDTGAKLLESNGTHFAYEAALGGSTVPIENLTVVVANGKTYFPDFDVFFDYEISNLSLVPTENNYAYANGHYAAAYSFDLDYINTRPAGWTDASSGGLAHTKILNEIGNHRKVLEFFDNDTGNHPKSSISFDQQTTGSVELYYCTNNPTENVLRMWVMNGATTGSGFYKERDTTTWCSVPSLTSLGAIAANTWYHLRITFDCSGASDTYAMYVDEVLFKTETGASDLSGINRFSVWGGNVASNVSMYIDAFDYSWANGYYLNRNMELNNSRDLWNWYAYPEWEPYEWQATAAGQAIRDTTVGSLLSSASAWTGYYGAAYSGSCELINNTKVHAVSSSEAQYLISSSLITFQGKYMKTSGSEVFFGLGTYDYYYAGFYGTTTSLYPSLNGTIQWGLGVGNTATTDNWTNFKIIYTTTGNVSLYFENTLIYSYFSDGTSINRIKIQNNGVNLAYFTAYSLSTETGYFINMNLLENTTASPLPMQTVNITQCSLTAAETAITVYPYTSTLTQLDYSNYAYTISDLYNNELETGWLLETESEIVYTPPEVRQLFISLADQQNNYLNWENYKIRVNNTLIYSNSFYREIGTSWNVSIYTRFDKYITSTVHTVDRDENYIPITLTLYSLKIFNQQTAFLHYNITLDPNYYPGSTIFYSEWLAPNEIGTNKIPADYYKITLMHNETGTPQYTSYSLVFNNDDILLVSSSNTIFAVLQNINNLGTEIDSQFTYVALNFTNTNSVIGSQTVLLEINFANTNTTLENMLLSSVYSFEYLNSTLETIFLNQENSFAFLNSSVNSIYSLSSNSFTFINGSLNTLMTTTENSFQFLNTSIGTMAAISLNSFSYLNSSIENSITWMAQNFTYTNSQISNNQIALLTQFGIVLSNITNNSIDIMNNIVAVNSSISNLIADLQTNVLLVNNSIYTAVLNVSTALAIDSNNILGNLTITYQQNEFLTEIFKKTMFSDLLYANVNWSLVGYNYTLLEDQIQQVQFTNNYDDQAVALLLQYQGQIDTIMMEAGGATAEIFLPSANVTWRIRSVNTGEYLTEWEPVADNQIDFGTWDTEFPETEIVVDENITSADFLVAFAIIGATVAVYVWAVRKMKADSKIKKVRASEPTLRGGRTNNPVDSIRSGRREY